MGDRSAIQWTASSWTPIRARHRVTGKVGWACVRCSQGCVHCYAAAQNVWIGTGEDYIVGALKDIELFLDEDMLTSPLRWTKGRKIFVCSMTDLFWDQVPYEWADRMFAVMALAKHHEFQVLTKRADRMADYMRTPDRKRAIAATVMELSELLARQAGSHKGRVKLDDFSAAFKGDGVFPNLWLGVSTENQAAADERIPLLLQTPAAVRFLSVEPLLGPVDVGFGKWVRLAREVRSELPFLVSRAPAGVYRATSNGYGALSVGDTDGNLLGIKPDEFERLPLLDWVIVGGESGPGARACDLGWIRSVVAQCKAAGVPCFVKQLGARPFERTIEARDGLKLRDRKGGDPAEWPADLRVREFPQ